MTIDPAFALLISTPIVLLAIAAAIAARPSRRTAPIMAGCAVLALVVGCGKPSEQSQTTAAAPAGGATPQPAALAAAIRVVPLSSTQLEAAHHVKVGGTVAVDVLDVRPDGTHQEAVTIGAADTLHVIGWAYDDSKAMPCDAIALVVDKNHIFSGSYGYARTDVAAFYKDPARTNVGYGIAVPAGKLGAGSHAAQVVCVVANDARTTPRALNVIVR